MSWAWCGPLGLAAVATAVCAALAGAIRAEAARVEAAAAELKAVRVLRAQGPDGAGKG
jgi:hypothetical protein